MWKGESSGVMKEVVGMVEFSKDKNGGENVKGPCIWTHNKTKKNLGVPDNEIVGVVEMDEKIITRELEATNIVKSL